MNLLESFVQHLKQFPFIQPKQKQLLAVSGGVDSVVLCELMYKAGYDFLIAHCNFQLRGAESERDEQFVRSLGEKYGKGVLVQKFETERYAADNKASIQVAARKLRYDWFRSILHGEEDAAQENFNAQSIEQPELTPHNSTLTPYKAQHKPHYIVTAHHANDNIETILMNFFKGTGIAGLHGILPVQGKIFRPLLFAKKEELLDYADQNQLTYVEDSSNLTDKYTRNFFRQHLFPLLKEIYPEVEDNLLKNIERFSEAEELYKQAVEQHKKKLLEVKANEIHIPVLKLQKTPAVSTIVYEIVKDFGFKAIQVSEVVRLLESETGKYVLSSSHRVIKNRKWLIISPVATTEASNILIEEKDKQVIFNGGELLLKTIKLSSSFQIPSDKTVAGVDQGLIVFPLLLRKWKQGDYFYPLGMKKKKKLSRFFGDQKLSKTEKENVWVVEMDKKIVWIVGHRIDDRFKITPSTKEVLELKLQQ
ncbi:tRNA lysidine(34) synthetase TilS [Segetibacter aerophilus]|uniref:tRNA(Ile)-lysidine synthase n=1 Tax=Segetibacter aerophilus TaxID=670293 RepID=A0A512B7Y1_9BACT|nr:tRNA lysidine(34) synthetase TilS [Segetibacter aerophilus]GEO08068.1 tRNA(Ile)-lysidine synthase [Segetibacter aerophilus]